MSARRRLKSAGQFLWSCAKGSHPAAQGRDASRRDQSNKAACAPETWHSPSQGYFIILGTETCSQNGDHSLRSRTERECAPTSQICAAIRWVARQGLTPRRTGPRHRGGVHESGKQRAHQKLGLVKDKGDIRENQLTVNTKRKPKGY